MTPEQIDRIEAVSKRAAIAKVCTAVEWRPGSEVPQLATGDDRSFIVCVQRARTGKQYVFGATYANRLELEWEPFTYRDEVIAHGNGWECERGEDTGTVTGWFVEDAAEPRYSPLLSPGDVLIAWAAYPAPPSSAGEAEQKAGAVPEGWVLVPINPTPKMLSAMRKASITRHSDMYRAAIRAAPSPPKPARETKCDYCDGPGFLNVLDEDGEMVIDLCDAPAHDHEDDAPSTPQETQAPKGRAVSAGSLLRPAVHVDVTGKRPLPDLVVTRNGVPVADQAQGVRDFLEACTPKQDLQAAETVLAEERRNAARETQATGGTEAMVEAACHAYDAASHDFGMPSCERVLMRAALEAAERARAPNYTK